MVHIVKQKKKSIKFNVVRESRLIENLIEKLPDDDTVYKIVSFGGFSSIGFVNYIAAQTKIKKMEVSTLRVGKKQDHPRLCGEKPVLRPKQKVVVGSPPPMRGKELFPVVSVRRDISDKFSLFRRCCTPCLHTPLDRLVLSP